MKKIFLALIILVVTVSCNKGGEEKKLQNLINEKISKDLNAIGTMSAKYEAVFAHYEHKTIGFDELFIQKALYSVIYGFDIADAKINVKIGDDGAKILIVKLPAPHEIKEARNRRTLGIDKRFENYYPTDDNGKKINVSKALDRIIQKQVDKHQKQHIKQARKMTKQYFQALADSYGLKLKYTMQ